MAEDADGELTTYASYEALCASSLPLAIKRRFLPSMWPPAAGAAKPPLERCLRLLPHLADMGGFFVALLRKVRPLPGEREHAAAATTSDAQHTPSAALASAAATCRGDEHGGGSGGYAPVVASVLRALRSQLGLTLSLIHI